MPASGLNSRSMSKRPSSFVSSKTGLPTWRASISAKFGSAVPMLVMWSLPGPSMRIIVIPGARMLSAVTMKLTAVATEPMPSMIKPRVQ